MPEPIYTLPGDRNNFSVKYDDNNNPARKAALEGGWKHFNRHDPATGKTFYIWYRLTSRKLEVMVDYRLPADAPMGLYRIETFVPGRNATTRRAIFTIAHNFHSEAGNVAYDDKTTAIDMYHVFDQWVSLGEFLIDTKSNALSGRVRQYILSLEDPAVSVSFGPVRWIPLATNPSLGNTATASTSSPAIPATSTTTLEAPNTTPTAAEPATATPTPVLPAPSTPAAPVSSPEPEPEVTPVQPARPEDAPRFDAPIGTAEERNVALVTGHTLTGFGPIWLGNWYDATPFLAWYIFGYHTGADLNLTISPAADKDAPIYATADGTVTYAGDASTWGNIIVIEHPDALITLPTGQTQRQRVFSRYGHVSNRILVSKGHAVQRGEHIGFIGLARGATVGWHLHFDISYTELLRSRPASWPNLETVKALRAQGKENTREYFNAQVRVKKEVLTHYLDPYLFLKDNH